MQRHLNPISLTISTLLQSSRLQETDSWLVLAYRHRHVEALELLLHHGADWNDVDDQVSQTLCTCCGNLTSSSLE